MRIDGARDRWAAALFGGASLMIMALPFLMLVEVVSAGLPRLSWEFLYAPPLDAGRAGGIGPMIVSTLAILAVCLCAALPIGLGCALYLAECVPAGGRAARALGYSLDVLGGVPSIVFGLFGYRTAKARLEHAIRQAGDVAGGRRGRRRGHRRSTGRASGAHQRLRTQAGPDGAQMQRA